MKKGLVGIVVLLSIFILCDLVVRPILDPAGRQSYSYTKNVACGIFSPQKEYQKMGSAGATTDLVNGGYWCKSDDEVRLWTEDHAG